MTGAQAVILGTVYTSVAQSRYDFMWPLEATRQSACRLTCVASSLRIETKMLDDDSDTRVEAFALGRRTTGEE
jgi:hypothetical protein